MGKKSSTYLINGCKLLLHESSQYIIYITSIIYTCIILFVYYTYRVWLTGRTWASGARFSRGCDGRDDQAEWRRRQRRSAICTEKSASNRVVYGLVKYAPWQHSWALLYDCFLCHATCWRIGVVGACVVRIILHPKIYLVRAAIYACGAIWFFFQLIPTKFQNVNKPIVFHFQDTFFSLYI